MNRKITRLLCGLMGAGIVCSASLAAGPANSRFQQISVAIPAKTQVVPRSLDTTPVTVVAVLDAPSVANMQEAAGRRLTREERQSIKAQRRAEQSGKRGQIEAAGGHVIGSFQSAVNGLKVRIPQNQIETLRQVPGVAKVLRVGTFTHENAVSVPRISAPQAWAGVNGVHGENIKIAIIDTGIDYTHANFGGPGTVDAFNAAFAASTAPADPALFGPNAPKVKGGIDLVGDDYDANVATSVPVPDPNPLDCNGHGSHVAGSAAGFGVKSDGTQYTGPYDNLTHVNNTFRIGPGVAPKADLYAVRVFGCEGSTNVVVDAIEWAIDNDMDVISMSLGSDFGPADSADALAADDASKAGVVVVSAAGNAGNFNYILGSPGAATKGIAVAAGNKELSDRTANFALPATATAAAKTIPAINANNANWISPSNLEVKVLRTSTGGVSLGCDPAEYVAAGVAGKIAVVQRGTCARVARAIFGQQAGAAAVVMINNAATLPPFEGEITENPDDGTKYTVTIPFFGVKGTAANAASDGSALVARDGMTINLTEGVPMIPPIASFSSTGPRTPDAKLKPDITAPGVAITSTLVGSGNDSLTISGTSMATPHISGTAALVLQAHPKWRPAAIKSAIMNSGDPSAFPDYAARRAGTGMVNAAKAVGTQAYAFADRDETTANFGVEEFATDLTRTHQLTVKNDGNSPVTFNVSVTNKAGSPHTATVNQSTITVPPHGQTICLDLTLTVPAATAGNSDAFRDVAGLVTFTPVGGSNKGIDLKVPYYIVPRVSSNVAAALAIPKKSDTGVVAVTNQASPISATADFYAWGLEDANDKLGRFDVRAAGVQSFPDGTIVFAVNTFKPWSTPVSDEFDIYVDSNGDGVDDYVLFNADFGLLSTGTFSGQEVVAVLNLNTNGIAVNFLAQASTDSSTMLLPVTAASIGISTANPRFTYHMFGFDFFGDGADEVPGKASFNAFASAINTGQFASVAPNATVSVPVAINRPEAAITPPLGYMIVTQDNKNGAHEAKLIRMKF